MHFGADGKLYVGVGDNANGAQAQNLALPFGKLLRFNDDGTIPADNPFAASQSGLGRAVWAYGLRNPYTFAVQPGTGTIYINDVGEVTWEEINVGIAGANYGWPASEGPDNVGSGVRGPLFTYKHSDANPLGSGAGGFFKGFAIAGGAFYPSTRRLSRRATATSTTSPTTSASSSAGSISPTATPPMRSPISPARRSICWSASTAPSTC